MSENLSPLRDIKEELQEAKTRHNKQVQQGFQELGRALMPLYDEYGLRDDPLKFIPTRLERTKQRNTVVFTIVDSEQPDVNVGPFLAGVAGSDKLHDFKIEFPSFTSVSANLPHMPRGFKKSLEQALKIQSTQNAKEFFERLEKIRSQWATRNKALVEKQSKIDEIEEKLTEIQDNPKATDTDKRIEQSKLFKELYQIYLPEYKQFTQKRLSKLNKPTRLPKQTLDEIAAHFDEQYEKLRQKPRPSAKDYPNLTKLVNTGIADLPLKRLVEYMKKARKPTFYGDALRTEKAIANRVPEDFALNHYSTVIKKADPQTQWALKQHPFDNVLLATQLIPRPKGALALLEKAQKVKQHLPPNATNEIAIAISRTLGRDEPNPENISQVINGEKTDTFLNVLTQIPHATTHLASLDTKTPSFIISRPAPRKRIAVPQPQAIKQRQQAIHDKLVWSEEVMYEIQKQPFTAAELAKAMIYGFNLANAKRKAIGEVYFKQSDIKKHVFAQVGNDGPKYRAIIKFLDSHGLIIQHKVGSDAPLSLSLNENDKSEVGKAIASEVKRFMFEVRK